MSFTMTCRHSDTEVSADDEDEFVAAVQAHIASHDPIHIPSRDHILKRYRRLHPHGTDG